jgi:5-dehydro-4-deoxyglucarate dehydratase
MAQTEIELDGLLAFPLTPFTEDLEVNLDALAENVESHIAAGAGALFVACGTGVFTAPAAASLLDIPSVVGLKDGYGDVEVMTRIVTTIRSLDTDRARKFLFFNGLPTAEVSAKAYASIGVARYSSAVHCFAPEIAHRFHRALAEGDTAVMDTLLAGFYLPLVALRDESPGFAVSLVKAAARLRGDKVGSVRPPLVEPTPEQIDRLQKIVEDGFTTLKALS